ncbi:MAG: hypothetical protein H8E48_06435, partial [Chloroflexi bacterium]|nr:hypothetical protein [Chloroflexota bacterium]
MGSTSISFLVSFSRSKAWACTLCGYCEEGSEEQGGGEEGGGGLCAENDHCGNDAPLDGPFGQNCYCNEDCLFFDDCCDDACDSCGFCGDEGGGEGFEGGDEDTDGDGVLDADDNCVFVENDQTDTDNDG